MCGPEDKPAHRGPWSPALPALFFAGVLGACSVQDPGGVRFRVTSTPPPDDKVLSPLLDPRLSSIELHGRDDKDRDVVLGRARYDRAELQTAEGGGPPTLSLGQVPIFDKRDLQLVALGAGGQQVLGLATVRDAEARYGESHEYTFDLRRPLFFFGSGRKLVPPIPFSEEDKPLSPGRRIVDALRQENLLRVVDPNSGIPLLPSYALTLDGPRQALASAATSDGLSVLVVTEGGTLHVIGTLQLKAALSVKLPTDMPAQGVAVSARDDSAAILHYDVPSPAVGTVGRLTLLRDLAGLRSRVSKDGDPLVIEIKSEVMALMGPPLSATYAPDGLLDVVFGRPPLVGGEPNCVLLAGDKGVLRRYDPKTGQVKHQSAIAYTTAVAYAGGGEQLLVQPCVQPGGANRAGQVAFRQWAGESFAQKRVLSAPGSADIAVVGGNAVVVVGRDDVAEDGRGTTQAHGMVRVLEPGLTTWSLQSPFSLDDWLLPFRVTTSNGVPLPASVEIVLAPRDLLVYRIVATPDRSRALVTARVTYQVSNMYLDSLSETEDCNLDWLGYTYHVMLVNLQTGAREQSWLVGVQNQSCDSRINQTTRRCFPDCQAPDGKSGPLRGYQEGFIPTGTSALFSGQ
jgi:hypothetical protein